MAEPTPVSETVRDLIDAYLGGTIDAVELAKLEECLRTDETARRYFARCAQTHTDLALELTARSAGDRALLRIENLPISQDTVTKRRSSLRPSVGWLVAASLVFGMVVGGGVVGLLASPKGVEPVSVVKPRTLALDFRGPHIGSLADATGIGTGFTHRLPGTGGAFAAHDPNWKLSPASGLLELTATGSDLNTRFRVDEAEYPGMRLADLGFTGAEDFEVAAVVQDVPKMEFVGQFGVFAGVSSDWAVRGGLVSQREPDSYRQFAVNTRDGRDKDAYFVGLGSPGDEIRIQLNRIAGKFSVAVENRTSGATSTLAIRHPEFLDGRGDLIVGIFAADPRGKDHKAVRFASFSATVWNVLPAPR
jgi:hypothetical protein